VIRNIFFDSLLSGNNRTVWIRRNQPAFLAQAFCCEAANTG
jgi:hypothetical protein